MKTNTIVKIVLGVSLILIASVAYNNWDDKEKYIPPPPIQFPQFFNAYYGKGDAEKLGKKPYFTYRVKEGKADGQVTLICQEALFIETVVFKPQSASDIGQFREEDPASNPPLRTGTFTHSGNSWGGYDFRCTYDDGVSYTLRLMPVW
jgi:hypothetical protein